MPAVAARVWWLGASRLPSRSGRPYRDQTYWGRGVPGFGDPAARVLVLGLAPAAHGANRTGRVFTGDRSGDWLFRAMYRAGFANQPTSVSVDDGLSLTGAWVTAAVKCAPPDNKPLPAEREACRPFLLRELAPARRVGCRRLSRCASPTRPPAPSSGCGRARSSATASRSLAPDGLTLLCSFHPSQQNTFTGRLTEPMLDAVFERADELAGG